MNFQRGIILSASFFEGFVKFSINALMFYYMRSHVFLSVAAARALVHLHFSLYYFSMSTLPMFLPKQCSAYLVHFIGSVLLMLCLIAFTSIEVLFDTIGLPNPFSLSEHTHNHPHGYHENTRSLMMTVNIFKLLLIAVSAMFSGAKTFTLRITLANLLGPRSHGTSSFRIQKSISSDIGKVVGLVVIIYSSKHDVHLHFQNVFLILTAASFIECAILIAGFWSPSLRAKGPIPKGLLGFFKLHTRKEMSQSEIIESRGELKTLIKLTPIFVPAMFVIAFRDQRFSQYQYQAELLDPDVNGYVLPPFLLCLLYPLIKCIGLTVVDGWFMPYRKKRGKPITITHRAVAGFVFVTISLAAATILQCHIEASERPQLSSEKITLIIYNSLNCPAVIHLQGFDKGTVCNSLSLKEIILDQLPIGLRVVVQSQCPENDFIAVDSINLTDYGVYEFIYYVSGERATSLSLIKPERFASSFNINTMIRMIFVPYRDYSNSSCEPKYAEFLLIGKRRGLMMSYNFSRYPTPDFISEDQYVPPDRYYFVLNGVTLLDQYVSYGAVLTFLVASSSEENLPLTKMFTHVSTNAIRIYHQIPQMILMGLSDTMLESPTFLYASNAVPRKWMNVVYELWLSSCGLGNAITSVVIFFSGTIRVVLALLLGFGLCWLSVAMLVQLSETVYTVDYEFLEDREGSFKTEHELE